MDENRNERIEEIIRILRATYPEAKCSLHFRTPFQLVVSTILAAQSTDRNVNEVTKTLFVKYPTPADFANADPVELEKDIHSTGFFRQKTRSIMEASFDIVNEYGGQVPDTMDELIKLRGVGRKTANVVLSCAFGKPAIIVDTHMLRVSGRLGLVDQRLADKKDADKVEQQLLEIVPEKDQTLFSHLIVFLGRDICTARNPKHELCPVLHLCPTGRSELRLS